MYQLKYTLSVIIFIFLEVIYYVFWKLNYNKNENRFE